MADPNKRPIIVKKIKKVSGGHHGGAWKVAYADFVTAMMAFFLLLWLLAQVPKDKLRGISDYFKPTVGIKEKVGVGLKGASGEIDNGIKTKQAAAPNVMQGAPPQEGDIAKAPTTDDSTEAENPDNSAEKLQVNKNEAEEIAAAVDKKHFEEIQKELNDAIEKTPELKEFKNNLQIKQTQEGLQIEITDLGNTSMFEIGSSKLKAATQPLLAKVAETIGKVDNKVSIIGHTDSLNYKNANGYSNWELSADRANSSRRFLVESGLNQDRIFKVEGKADRDHLVKDDPNSAQNRRISIILLKKSLAPTTPIPVDGKVPDGPNVDAPGTSPAASPATPPVKALPSDGPQLKTENAPSGSETLADVPGEKSAHDILRNKI